MKKSHPIALLAVGVVVLAAMATLLVVFVVNTQTTLEVRIRDSVSKQWVWDASMRIQHRLITAYYQSDAGLRMYRFTHLTPGKTTLAASAPGYQERVFPLTLRRGANRIDVPIDMTGLEIPDLAGFFVFEKLEGPDIVGELRPVNSSGGAVLNHPCIDLWIGCRVAVELKDGVPVREETTEGASRGEVLLQGEIPWAWNPAPQTQFRYSVRIQGERMKADPSLYRVIDYLLVEPDPLRMTRQEIGDLMARVYALGDARSISSALDAQRGRLRYFFYTSWNVKARQE